MRKHVLKAAAIALLLFFLLIPTSCAETDADSFSFSENGDGYTLVSVKTHKNKVVVPDKHLGKPVTGIGDSAFYNDASLLSLTIPSSVLYIEANAFAACVNLSGVTFEAGGACAIGEEAFFGCSSLSDLSLNSSVHSIGDRAFQNCTSLKKVSDDGSILYIGRDAFKNCEKLIVDAPEDSYAYAYAQKNAISVSFFSKDLLIPLGIVLGAAIGLLAVFLSNLYKKRKNGKETLEIRSKK